MDATNAYFLGHHHDQVVALMNKKFQDLLDYDKTKNRKILHVDWWVPFYAGAQNNFLFLKSIANHALSSLQDRGQPHRSHQEGGQWFCCPRWHERRGPEAQ